MLLFEDFLLFTFVIHLINIKCFSRSNPHKCMQVLKNQFSNLDIVRFPFFDCKFRGCLLYNFWYINIFCYISLTGFQLIISYHFCLASVRCTIREIYYGSITVFFKSCIVFFFCNYICFVPFFSWYKQHFHFCQIAHKSPLPV